MFQNDSSFFSFYSSSILWGGGNEQPSEITISGIVKAASLPISAAIVSLQGLDVVSGVTKVLSSSNSLKDGTFSLSSSISPGSFLYLSTEGGSVNIGSNSYIHFLIPLGMADRIPVSNVVVNELTTMATVHAFYGFMKNGSIAISSMAGLNGAFSIFQNLVNIKTGGIEPNAGFFSSDTLETQANILSLCTQDETNCSMINSDLDLPSQSDTVVMSTALHTDFPSATAVSSLSNLSGYLADNSASLPFPDAPTSITPSAILLRFPQTAINNFENPFSAMVDGDGNVWVPNFGNSSVTELVVNKNFSALNFPSDPINQISSPSNIAIDQENNIWIVNNGNNSITKLTKNNNSYTGTNFAEDATNNFQGPNDLIADGFGNIWVTNATNNSVTEITPILSGYIFKNFGPSGTGISNPQAPAADINGDIWIANFDNNSVTELVRNGPDAYTPKIFSPNAQNNMFHPTGIELDISVNVWIANYANDSITGSGLTEFLKTSSGFIPQFIPSTNTNNFNGLTNIMVDAGGNVWIPNLNNDSLTELPLGNASEAIVFQGSQSCFCGFSGPQDLSVDSAGNVWVANFSDSSVTVVVGMATPTQTPMNGPPSLPLIH